MFSQCTPGPTPYIYGHVHLFKSELPPLLGRSAPGSAPYIYMWFRTGYAPGVCARLCLPRALWVVSCQQTACAPHMRRGLRQGTPAKGPLPLPSAGAPPKTSPIATYKKRSAPGSAPYIYICDFCSLPVGLRQGLRRIYIYIYIYIYICDSEKTERGSSCRSQRRNKCTGPYIYIYIYILPRD